MGNVVAGYASSHAFTFYPPERWAEFRERNRATYERRTGKKATEPVGLKDEDVEAIPGRYRHILDGLEAIRESARALRPDALVIIGDDQNENLLADNLPQLAIYTGGEFRTGGHFGRGDRTYEPHQALAAELLEKGIDSGFDIASLGSLESDTLSSHAHAQIVDEIFEGFDIPVVLVFINAIHFPAISPDRCYRFGQVIAQTVAESSAAERVAVVASGGLSHYTAGYPWAAYTGERGHGDIDIDFDLETLEILEAGDAERLAELTSVDLLEHGNIELRAWIGMAGAIGRTKPKSLVYEPFFNAIMGMSVGVWET